MKSKLISGLCILSLLYACSDTDLPTKPLENESSTPKPSSQLTYNPITLDNIVDIKQTLFPTKIEVSDTIRLEAQGIKKDQSTTNDEIEWEWEPSEMARREGDLLVLLETGTLKLTAFAKDHPEIRKETFIKVVEHLSTGTNKTSAPLSNLYNFSFLKKDNPGLKGDSYGRLTNRQIDIYVPIGTDLTNLKAHFELPQETELHFKNQVQTSGESAQDYSSALTFQVKDGDYISDLPVNVLSTSSVVDNIFSTHMPFYRIPQLSFAIALDEKQVYARALNHFEVISLGKPRVPELTMNHQMRLGNLSKLVTAIAILQLVDQNQLNLDALVFGEQGILGQDYGTSPYSEHVKRITIRHLLEHSAGGWEYDVNNSKQDTLSSYYHLPQADIISKVLDEQPLISAPGETRRLSHFGYFVLGRVIEKITGQSYFETVQNQLLKPLGINMRLDNQAGDKGLDIPHYQSFYLQEANEPAGYYGKGDAAWGWLGSPSELLKLMVYADGKDKKKDIISKISFEAMTNREGTHPLQGFGFEFKAQSDIRWLGTRMGGSFGWVGWFPNLNGMHVVVLSNYQQGVRPGEEENNYFEYFSEQVWKLLIALNRDEFPNYDLF